MQSDDYELTYSLSNAPHPGLLLRTTPGERAIVALNRTQHARRVYRVACAGIYRDSVLVGAPVPIDKPLLPKGGVVGQDSLLASRGLQEQSVLGFRRCPLNAQRVPGTRIANTMENSHSVPHHVSAGVTQATQCHQHCITSHQMTLEHPAAWPMGHQRVPL